MSPMPITAPQAQTLEIRQIGDHVLRQPARELTLEEILSDEIQQLIEKMALAMRTAPGVGVAAPQIGKALQLIVIEDINHSHLTKEQLIERERKPVAFHVLINPKLTIIEHTEKKEFFEGCLSVPGLFGIVPRAESVIVECLNERAEPVVINARGWYARILQHEIDHLNGTLYIDKAYLTSLVNEDHYDTLIKTKTMQEIRKEMCMTKECKLLEKHCAPCKGGVPPLAGEPLIALYKQLGGGWKIVDGHHLEKEYTFKDFQQALDFTNQIGALAEEEGHHPDILLSYGKVKLQLWTHKVNGLTESDFILAAKCDQIKG